MRPSARRTFVLRQAGLLELGAYAPTRDSFRLALVDGAVDATHPALSGARVVSTGSSTSTAAGEHATFSASILVGGRAGEAGASLAICSGCTLFNYAAVTDEMLRAGASLRRVAETLAVALIAAVHAGCRVVVFGIEVRQPQSAEWQPLREALRTATRAGAAVFLPSGNRASARDDMACDWPDVLLVASVDWRGHASSFSAGTRRAGNMILAPGEHIPGAGPAGGFTVRSGTSFAAAIAAGAVGLAMCLARNRSPADIVADLCRPPQRALDGTGLFNKPFRPSQQGEHHAIGNA